jgi:tRNA threonylcarbamoyladenosine biosynthesis protein TsaE
MNPIFGEHRSESPDQTGTIAHRLASTLNAGDLIALRGDLGAGKTRFVRALAEGLGHDPAQVSSPTYVLLHEYESPTARIPLAHLDAYRLRGVEDLDSIDWDGLLTSSAAIAVEWPERIEARLPVRRIEVFIDHAGDDCRLISISRVGFDQRKPCRTCAGPVKNAGDAFCSDRCRMADLGKWFNGEYRVTRELKDVDLEEGV